MQKMQKIGFIGSAATFLVVGIILLAVGFIAANPTLKLMGALLTPLAVINFLLLLYLVNKAN